jgi:outer membrane protein assembly factor BamB
MLTRAAIVVCLAVGALANYPFGTSSHGAQRLISQEQARHLGLERAWFAQVRLDPARNRVERAVLTGQRLTVLTSAGVVHEFDANTGETLWAASIGNPNFPSLGPAANDRFVALLNGSTLYVLDRADGKPVVIRKVGGAPGASPAIGKEHVFVPLFNGRVEGYPFDELPLTPWYYQSIGRATVPPLVTPRSLVWTTATGHLYVAGSQELGLRFRLETGSDVLAHPAYRKPLIYVATASGEVFAMDEETAAREWKYATGFLVTRAPAAVADRVYVTSEEPALHCIDAKTGNAVWEAADVTQFAAASRNRVYGVDELNALVVLDATTGALQGRMHSDGTLNALVNDQNDRLYLVTDEGAVQCLHEIGAKEPLIHNPPEAEPADQPEGAPSDPAIEAATGSQPSIESQPPAADDEDPFAGEAEDAAGPAEEMPAEEQPFGAGDENPFGEL